MSGCCWTPLHSTQMPDLLFVLSRIQTQILDLFLARYQDLYRGKRFVVCHLLNLNQTPDLLFAISRTQTLVLGQIRMSGSRFKTQTLVFSRPDIHYSNPDPRFVIGHIQYGQGVGEYSGATPVCAHL
ncbi:hypothetical protein DPMN_014364 [Dreissena polymorpha]|uniref:Uncharacterized protein n=1 Tax=Dreissena polymorpha TaxID=45954 RepID=A0A9D4N992_DREPO|nr:hypothetical protein DPMN_014364 [Dreissena polymorpha]